MNQRVYQNLEFDKIVRQLSGLSFSVLGRTACEALEPAADFNEVSQRLAQTHDAMHVLLTRGTPPLQSLDDIRPSVKRAELGSDLSTVELLHLASFLRCTARLRGAVPDTLADPSVNLVYDLMARMEPCEALEHAISAAVIGEEEIADRASAKLADIRRRMLQTQSSLRANLDRIIRDKASYLQEALVTQRFDRFVVPVKAAFRAQVPGIVHDASGSGQTLFIEPMAVVDANNKLKELAAAERAEIARILHDLSQQTATQAGAILRDAERIQAVDFMIAKGRLAIKMKAIIPRLNQTGQINLKQARHPLIDPQKVVPIDIRVGESFKTLLITGPNTGGKTVALKTCGLFALMTMAGLAIPAAEPSHMSVFTEVLPDIGDEQSIEQSLSTFSAHMTHVVEITKACGPTTLVLVDELGSGTDPSEGAALAMAILDYFRQRGAITVATTHYHELKAYALETDGVENASCEFDTETLKPTYRLLIGVPGVSNAFVISRKLGLSESIVDTARSFLAEENIRFENLVQKLDRQRREADQALQTAQQEQAESHRLLEAAQREKQAWQQRRSELTNRYNEEKRRELKDELDIIEALLSDIRQAYAAGKLNEAESQGNRLRQEMKRRLNAVEGEIGKQTLSAAHQGLTASGPDKLVVGETYFAPALNLQGRLVSGPDKQGQCILASGSLQVNVAAAELRQPNRQTGRQARVVQSDHIQTSRRLTFSPEIKLLGQTADEALVNLDQYLDDAVLASAASVRIVHGKGSGVLRKAVADFLRKDRRIQSFQLAPYGEGDSGVTIAKLR